MNRGRIIIAIAVFIAAIRMFNSATLNPLEGGKFYKGTLGTFVKYENRANVEFVPTLDKNKKIEFKDKDNLTEVKNGKK